MNLYGSLYGVVGGGGLKGGYCSSNKSRTLSLYSIPLVTTEETNFENEMKHAFILESMPLK